MWFSRAVFDSLTLSSHAVVNRQRDLVRRIIQMRRAGVGMLKDAVPIVLERHVDYDFRDRRVC